MMVNKPRRCCRLLIAFVVLLTAQYVESAAITTNSGAAGECSAMQTYKCPNCGGINVTDCLTQCDGYRNTDKINSLCFRRTLFNVVGPKDDREEPSHRNYAWNDIVGTLVWFLAAGVATACGVGGGGIYVPLGMLLLQFAPKPASGLSQASIFGASLGGLMINLRAKHPNEGITAAEDADDDPQRTYTRPLIDYDMALVLAPMEMAGAVLGLLAQQLMPNWLYLLIASIILGFTSCKTFQKFFAARKGELQGRQEYQALDRINGEEDDFGADAETGDNHDGSTDENLDNEAVSESPANSGNSNCYLRLTKNGAGGFVAVAEADETDSEFTELSLSDDSSTKPDERQLELRLRRQYLEEDERQYPREKLLALIGLWVGLSLLTFLKGGKGVDSLVGITCESPWYYVLICFQFLWTMGFASVFGAKLVKRQAQKDAVGYPFQPHDVLWYADKLYFYCCVAFVAGCVAGLIGIGGGMVLGPLMLVMNIHPRVSSATTATMIVLTSSSVAIMFVISGVVPWSYAVYFFGICFIGALVGKTYIDDHVKRTGKTSLLIGILATMIALATIGCLVIVIMDLSQNDWCLSGFKRFCYVGNDGGHDAACAVSIDEHRLLGYNPNFYAHVVTASSDTGLAL